jgi:amino acid transporter
MSLIELIFGRRLATNESTSQQIGPLIGVAILGLDALSSAAYGPEAALTVLLPSGIESSRFIGLITLPIIILLLILLFSYRQTISAYPQGGGSYTVAKENLGNLPGLITAAGLSIDYILNVGVAISAGVGALVSAFPILLPYTLILCLIILAIIAIANLRGIRETGLLFIIPTYFFVGCIFISIFTGIFHTLFSYEYHVTVVNQTQQHVILSAAGFWLILRSFASGCTAMTGVEAVSNGVPLFKPPGVKWASITLSMVIITLVLMLAGIAFMIIHYHIGATQPGAPGYQSVLSQLFEVVFGRGVFYHISIASVIIILALSANTSFAGFPRVCRLLAIDNFLPKVFLHRGRRLVYAEGIYLLIIVDAILLITFKGITDKLIPLFAIGAFIAFTCSQAGMVRYWWKKRQDKKALYSLIINSIGAICTFIAFVVIFCSKFLEGAWLTLFAVPILVLMFQRERKYNDKISNRALLSNPISIRQIQSPIAVLPIHALDRVAEKGIQLGLEISTVLFVVHVQADDESEGLWQQWNSLVEKPASEKKYPVPKLVILPSKYREVIEPVINYISELRMHFPDRKIIVIIPQIIEPRWYHYIFRNTAMLLESSLLWQKWHNVFVLSSPMHLTEE